MRAGDLREIIVLQQAEVIKDSYGDEKVIYRALDPIRAAVEYDPLTRTTSGVEIFYNQTLTVTIRHYHKVEESMRVLFGIKQYRIKSIKPNQTEQCQTLICELINE